MPKIAGKPGFLLIMGVLLAFPARAQDAVLSYPLSYFQGAQLVTAYDMVGRLPGFLYDGGNSNTRGFNGSGGNVLIDSARPTAKTDDLTTILQRIPAAKVDHIDVIRGGAPGIDMQGAQVVANVVRKAEDSTDLIVTLNTDYYSNGKNKPYGNVELLYKSGDASYDLTLTRFGNLNDDFLGAGTQSFIVPGQPTLVVDARRRGPDRMGWGMNGIATWPLLGGSFGVNLTLRATAQNKTQLYAAPRTAAYLDSLKTRAGELGLHWDGNIGPLEVNLVGLQRLTRQVSYLPNSDWTGTSVFNGLRMTRETIVRSAFRYRASSDLILEASGEGAYNSLDGQTSLSVNGVPQAVVGANAGVHELRGELFTQADWMISPRWSLEAGTRAEFSTIVARGVTPRSFAFLKPRVLLSWSPFEGQQFRARVQRVVGQLDFANFIATSNTLNGVSAGNSGLKPDHRWQIEGDYEWHFWDKGALLLTYLHEDIKDLVDFIPLGNGQDGPGNVPKAVNEQYGVEFNLPLAKLGLDGGQFKTSLLWRASALNDPVTGEIRSISNVNSRRLKFDWLQDMPGLRSSLDLGLQLPFVRPTYRIAQVTKLRVGSFLYFNWDYKPAPDLTIQFQFSNMLPYHGEFEQDFYAGPRNIALLSRINDLNLTTLRQFRIQLRKTF